MNDFEVTYNGVTLGAGAYYMSKITGINELPDLDFVNPINIQRQGLSPGDVYARERMIEIDLDIKADTDAAFLTAIDELTEATSPTIDEKQLGMQFPTRFGGNEVFINARCVRRNLPIDLRYTYRNVEASLQFLATYPFFQDATEQSVLLNLASATGGRTYNQTYNRTYGTASTGGAETITNSGNTSADFIATLNGPLIKPKLTLVDTGEFLELDLTIVSGSSIVLGSKEKTVFIGGNIDRSSLLTKGSEWWTVPVGGSEVVLTAQTFDSGSCNFSFRSTYV